LVLLFSGCEDQKNGQNEVVKNTNESTMTKATNTRLEMMSLLFVKTLVLLNVLTIIIPAIWDREVERDCS
jgi:hypothetical protein